MLKSGTETGSRAFVLFSGAKQARNVVAMRCDGWHSLMDQVIIDRLTPKKYKGHQADRAKLRLIQFREPFPAKKNMKNILLVFRLIFIGIIFTLNPIFGRQLFARVTNNTPPCDPPPSGIVSWWRGEGNTANSFGVNNGSSVGTLGYTNGEVGLAFDLDGVSSYVLLTNSPFLDPAGAFSIEAWIYPTQDGGERRTGIWMFFPNGATRVSTRTTRATSLQPRQALVSRSIFLIWPTSGTLHSRPFRLPTC